MLNRATMHQEFVTLSDGHAAAAGQSSVILLHRPSTFSRCLNRDGQGDVIEMTELSPTARRGPVVVVGCRVSVRDRP